MSQWQSPVYQGTAPSSPPSSARKSGRGPRSAIIVVVLVVTIVATVAFGLFVGGVFDGREETPTTATSPTAAPPPTPRPAPTPEEVPGTTIGTRENPYGPGDSFTILDDWTFTLGATDTDTWPDVAAYFEQHAADKLHLHQPAPGMVFVSAPATLTYTGSPEGRDRVDFFTVHHIAADGTESMINSCGRYGTSVEPFNTVYEDPVVEGVPCVEVTPTQAIGGQWRVAVWFGPDEDEVVTDIFYTAG